MSHSATRFFFSCVLLLMVTHLPSVLLHSAVAQDRKALAVRQLELSNQKLALEIQKLEESGQAGWLTLPGQFLTQLLPWVALAWTIWIGRKTYLQKIREERNARISSLLESLSSDNDMARHGAIRGLYLYADEAVPHLLSAAIHEEKAFLIEDLHETLVNAKNEGVQRVFEGNFSSSYRRVSRLGEIDLASELHQFCDDAGFSVDGFLLLKETYKDRYEANRRAAKAHELVDEQKEDAKKRISEALFFDKKMAGITGKVIARWFRERRPVAFPLRGMDLTGNNLYRMSIENVGCEYSLFFQAIMRHCHIIHSKMRHCEFSHADMIDAILNGSDFRGSFFKQTQLISAHGKRADFSGCHLDGAFLSKGDFSGSRFEKADCRYAKFGGAKLIGCNFESAKLMHATLSGADLSRSVLIGANISSGAQLKNTNLTGVDAEGANFKGSDLRWANFHRANLKGAEFSGADLKNTDFRCAKGLESADMAHAKNKDQALFA